MIAPTFTLWVSWVHGMSLVDILIWAVLLLFVVKGLMKGLVREVCSLLGLVAGGWAAFKYCHYLAEAVRSFIRLPQHVTLVLSFLLIFFILGLLFYFFGHLLTVVFKIMLMGGVNRVGGGVFGLLEGAFILCMVLYLCTTKPMPEKLKGYLLRSRTAQTFIQSGHEIVAGWEGGAHRAKPLN
ncbi:MAG: membrane protein required for colicin V [Geobacteraceae bacterium]|nr:MAG: membrane protein required for colicin V [Geobacteraceae bacterium]